MKTEVTPTSGTNAKDTRTGGTSQDAWWSNADGGRTPGSTCQTCSTGTEGWAGKAQDDCSWRPAEAKSDDGQAERDEEAAKRSGSDARRRSSEAGGADGA